jgi:hypothetical protein
MGIDCHFPIKRCPGYLHSQPHLDKTLYNQAWSPDPGQQVPVTNIDHPDYFSPASPSPTPPESR